MRIAKILKSYRKINYITLEDLSDEIGISCATISRIENGKNPDFETYRKLLAWMF